MKVTASMKLLYKIAENLLETLKSLTIKIVLLCSQMKNRELVAIELFTALLCRALRFVSQEDSHVSGLMHEYQTIHSFKTGKVKH